MSLNIRNVGKKFPGAASSKNALNGVSLDVAEGELLVLLGPSGSGKTTLLRCIAGLIQPSSGTIKLGDRVVLDKEAGIEVPTNKRDLGMVFQSFALWPHMTVAQNVGYPLRARGRNKNEIGNVVRTMLERVHCTEYADRLPTTLSGGQQQRVALARALAANPAIILFDEPLSNLDALLRIELRTQIRMIHHQTKFTGVYVTHDQVEAVSLGDRIAVMNDGAVEQIGKPEDIYFRPKTEFVATFMGMSNRIHISVDEAGRHNDMAALFPKSSDGHQGSYCVRFRPESVNLFGPGEMSGVDKSKDITLENARIVDRAFHGESLQYVIDVRNELITAAIDPRKIFQPGDVVTAVVAREGTSVFQSGSVRQAEPALA